MYINKVHNKIFIKKKNYRRERFELSNFNGNKK